ncbi:FtsQ-type POTRA domain-containing protein [Kiritimatiellota bacterium B12222]|nr:FtsQ-type POTRA domain-containing protein [Kiritimatiellota bacterium B12222]
MASKPIKKTKKRTTKRKNSVLQVKSTSRGNSTGLPTGAFFLFGGLCLLMLGWGLWLFFGWMGDLLFMKNERFTLQEVVVNSDGAISIPVLKSLSGIQEGENLFNVDIQNVQKRMENQAIVRKAVVRRVLPDTIAITVNERVPIARMGSVGGNMNWVLDEEGIILRKSFDHKHLPLIRGIDVKMMQQGGDLSEGRCGPVLPYLTTLRDMPGRIRDLLPVQDVNVGNPGFLDFRLKDGFNIYFPNEGNIEELIMKASRGIYEIQNRELNITFLDMRPEGQNKIGAPE